MDTRLLRTLSDNGERPPVTTEEDTSYFPLAGLDMLFVGDSSASLEPDNQPRVSSPSSDSSKTGKSHTHALILPLPLSL